MSDLAKEVAAEIKGAGADLKTWQRLALIAAANVFGLVLGAIVVAAAGQVWVKAMSVDTVRSEGAAQAAALQGSIDAASKVAEAGRRTIVEEMSAMGAEMEKLRLRVEAMDHADDAPEAALDPTASEVQERRDMIQQKIDKEVYRARNLRE